ncbi:NADP oxidoreductase [Candidatus Saccharibacteria bacterium 32-49-12]|nr:MAG: NADP oxidoreductase [Candidatus Saccharibacteria bacterium 32-49-12]
MSRRLAVLGFGKLGTVISQLATKAGYEVFVAGSGEPEKIALSVSVLAPGAIALPARDAIARADMVILALPLSKHRNLPADALAEKLVIDAMNYWWEVDGHDEQLSNPSTSSSELVQEFLSESRVVKALSHMGYHHLLDEAKAPGSPDRKAIAIAGDDPTDLDKVVQLVDDLGFDPLIIGRLASGRKLEPGQPAFGANVDKENLKQLVA